MPKEPIDPDSIKPYKNSQNQMLLAHKQIQNKISKEAIKTNKEKIEKLSNKLESKNTYFSQSKIPEINSKDLEKMEKESLRLQRASGLDKDDSYCQKCPTMKNKCIHKTQRVPIKDKFSYPITTSSAYGWLDPIDNLSDNHNIKSYIQGFYDKSHL